MSIQPTSAADRIASTGFSAASEKESIAGNAFAALFGQAYAQQANIAPQLPTAANAVSPQKGNEAAQPKQMLNARMPANEAGSEPATPTPEGKSESGADNSTEGLPKSEGSNGLQKKTAAQSEKKKEEANTTDAAASAMAMSQQQAPAAKAKPAASTTKTVSDNATQAMQNTQGKRLKKAADASDAKEATQAADAKNTLPANASSQPTAPAQTSEAAQALASTKPQANAAAGDAFNGSSASTAAVTAQAAASSLVKPATVQNDLAQTALPVATDGAGQKALKPGAAETEATLTTASLATSPKAAASAATDAQAETAAPKLADLPEFNRLLAAQSPLKEAGTAAATQTSLANPGTEKATDKLLQAATELRTAVAGAPKETRVQTSLQEEALSSKNAPLSSSVSDAGVSAKTSAAAKSETSLGESQIAGRNAAGPDRARISSVSLQQAASVQSSSNSSNVTTTAVEGLESKVAVPQNTGLQAAGLSVFQSMQRQDEPLKMEIATPITQPGFTEELTDTVKLVSTRDLREVEVTINPEELGPIKLKVQMTGDKAEVTFQAEHEQTRTLLAEAVSAMTESLAESGIDLRNTTVEKPPQSLENNTANFFQGQSNREQRNPDANFQQGQNRSGRQDNSGLGSDNTPRQQPAEMPARRNNGLLDTYA